MRLEYLRRLVDDGEVEVLYLQQVDVGVERRCRGAEHTRVGDKFADGASIAAVLCAVAEQVVAERLVAVEFRADAQEVDAALDEFAANFVDGAVGVRKQNHVGCGVGEFFFQNVEQSERCLARARRSDDEEDVARLLGTGYERVERAVVAAELLALVDCRLALAEQQVAAFFACGEKTMYAAVQRLHRRLEHVVLNSPAHVLGEVEHAAVGLRVAQHHLHAFLRDVADRGAVHHLCAGVRHTAQAVGIDDDDVARAEVGRINRARLAELQLQALNGVAVLAERGDGEPLVYVARRALVLERVEPYGGKTAVVFSLVANLGEQMLFADEAHEAQIVGKLQRRSHAYRVERTLQFGAHPFVPQSAAKHVAVEHIGC